ncbi:DUF2894 domain-containing protein [Ottowia oryzae]|uniref:DUF2894 domain-containing protein n=1 Tax=Ottowia oryzae TaxID=2109914 RepID=A0A2S0MB49_9BURK|nr:DUF2894 domain-containing protein [Ottowia oryzae]AVO33109.1 DUF2894 domain-containing protein [Ottowia oryzae]
MAEPALPGGSGAEPLPSAPGDAAAGPAPASAPAPAPAPADQPHPLLAQARAQDLPTRDPVRWRRIDALAQRAAQHSGATRQLLDARLQALMDEAAAAAAPATAAPSGSTAGTAPAPDAAAQTPTLSTLLARLQEVGMAAGAGSAAAEGDDRAAATSATAPLAARTSRPPRDLNIVQQHRGAWTQLRAEQRVAQSQTALPDQAGPLNSQLLLHRALTLMRETSPGYLQHLMGQAEALMWLEQALAAPSADAKTASRAKTAAKSPKAASRGRAAGKPSGGAARR